MSRPVIFASDLHGNRYAYDKLFKLAVERGIKAVVLGGDLTPKWPVICFGNRAIVPLDPRLFREDESGATYDAFLEEIEPLVYRNRTKAEKHFVSLGGYLMHTGVFYDWKTLREEQRILRRMVEDFPRFLADKKRGKPEKASFPLEVQDFLALERLLKTLPKETQNNDGFNLSNLLRGLRWFTLTTGEMESALAAMRAIHATLSEEVKKLSPAAQQCFSGFELPNIEPRGKELADYERTPEFCKTIAHLHPLSVAIEKRRDFHRLVKPQQVFLEMWLGRRVQKFKQDMPGAEVYLILGNDDVVENEAVVKRMHERGTIRLIDRRPVEIGSGYRIAGYPFVRDSHGKFYAGWEKSEEDIQAELEDLEHEAGDPLKTVFVVHTPPAYTALDQSFGDRHFGSQGIREWLRQGPKKLVLSGHIHESPFVGGQWRETVDGTPCIQPGAWHDEEVCAAVVDLDDPTDAEWIVDRSKIRA